MTHSKLHKSRTVKCLRSGRRLYPGTVSAITTLYLKKPKKGVVSRTWRKTALWKGVTLRAAVTSVGMKDVANPR